MRRHLVRTNEKLVFEALASLESPEKISKRGQASQANDKSLTNHV